MARREKLVAKGRKGKMEPVSKAEVRQMIRANTAEVVEKKVVYTTQNGGIDITGSVFSLTAGISHGDGAIGQFAGNIVKPVHLKINVEWSTNQQFTTARLIVFQWADSTVPASTGILQYTGSVIAPLSPLYWANVPLIHVLYDELTSLFPVAGSYAATNLVVNVSKMKKIWMNGSGAPSPQKNGLYVIAITDDSVATYPQLKFISELRFTDA